MVAMHLIKNIQLFMEHFRETLPGNQTYFINFFKNIQGGLLGYTWRKVNWMKAKKNVLHLTTRGE
jgi:hypothetical protein